MAGPSKSLFTLSPSVALQGDMDSSFSDMDMDCDLDQVDSLDTPVQTVAPVFSGWEPNTTSCPLITCIWFFLFQFLVYINGDISSSKGGRM